jgi:hypothetical protein
MTHKEHTKSDRKGFASSCPGELKELLSAADRTVSESGARETTVTVWGCGLCGAFLPTDSEGNVLNCYHRVEPGRVAAELAKALDAGRSEPCP